VSVLSLPEVSRRYTNNYASVHVDFGELAESDPRRAVAKRYNSSGLHPVLVFLDVQGREVVRIKGALKGKEDALLLDRFVSGKHYQKGDYNSFKAANGS
jgi:hypothetical protein